MEILRLWCRDYGPVQLKESTLWDGQAINIPHWSNFSYFLAMDSATNHLQSEKDVGTMKMSPVSPNQIQGSLMPPLSWKVCLNLLATTVGLMNYLKTTGALCKMQWQNWIVALAKLPQWCLSWHPTSQMMKQANRSLGQKRLVKLKTFLSILFSIYKMYAS